METPYGITRCHSGVRCCCLTDDVRVVDFLQELRLLVEALLVNAFLFAGTFAVDLLDSPRRRIQLFRPGNQWGREWEG